MLAVRKVMEIEGGDFLKLLLGERDENLRAVRRAFGVKASVRDGKLIVEGTAGEAEKAAAALERMKRALRSSGWLPEEEVELILGTVAAGGEEVSAGGLSVGRGRTVKPRTQGQAVYVETMEKNDIVFSTGPAGTGKTYLAVALALSRLSSGKTNRIFLVRPAVEAGEHLGFLPGDLREKVNPYLRPLYDALQDMLSYSIMSTYMERGIIEVAPLAYMRGRTLSNAFVILDEAQNTTPTQMKMFLTRLGVRSRAVITGDVTQVDLPEPRKSGLLQAWKILDGIPGIAFVELTERDIVRHPLVRKIVEAYERGSTGSSGLEHTEGRNS